MRVCIYVHECVVKSFFIIHDVGLNFQLLVSSKHSFSACRVKFPVAYFEKEAFSSWEKFWWDGIFLGLKFCGVKISWGGIFAGGILRVELSGWNFLGWNIHRTHPLPLLNPHCSSPIIPSVKTRTLSITILPYT